MTPPLKTPNALSVTDVKKRLPGLDRWFRAAASCPDNPYTDKDIDDVITATIRDFERDCQFRINARQVVCRPDGTYDTNSPIPVLKEDPYPYFRFLGDEFLVTTLNERPIQQIQRLRLMWNQTDLIYQMPTNWIQFNRKTGRFWVMPVNGNIAVYGAAYAWTELELAFGDKMYAPGILSFDYICGLPYNVSDPDDPTNWTFDQEWADLYRVLTQACAVAVLDDIANVFDPGTGSVVVGGDGISQTIQYDRFQPLKDTLQARIDAFKATLEAQETPMLMLAL